MLPFPPRAHTKAYFAVNPLGTIPALDDGGTVLTESAAICEYLAARHSPANSAWGRRAGFRPLPQRPAFRRGDPDLPQTLVLRYGRFEPPERRAPQIVADYGRWFHARLRAFAEVLGDRETVCAGRFTARDISIGYALLLAEFTASRTRCRRPSAPIGSG